MVLRLPLLFMFHNLLYSKCISIPLNDIFDPLGQSPPVVVIVFTRCVSTSVRPSVRPLVRPFVRFFIPPPRGQNKRCENNGHCRRGFGRVDL